MDLALKANKINVKVQQRQLQSVLGKLAKAIKLLCWHRCMCRNCTKHKIGVTCNLKGLLWWSIKAKAFRTQRTWDAEWTPWTVVKHGTITQFHRPKWDADRRKLSRSQADLDTLDMSDELCLQGHKHQDCEGGWQSDKDSAGTLLGSVEKCPCESSRACRCRDCPDIVMSSSGWKWDISNTNLRGPRKCQQGNIMHLCFKTKAPGVRPESSFVSSLSCP